MFVCTVTIERKSEEKKRKVSFALSSLSLSSCSAHYALGRAWMLYLSFFLLNLFHKLFVYKLQRFEKDSKKKRKKFHSRLLLNQRKQLSDIYSC